RHAEDHEHGGGVFAQPGWHDTSGVGVVRLRRHSTAAGAWTFVKCATRPALLPCGGRRSAPSRPARGNWRWPSAAAWRRGQTAPAPGTSRAAAPLHYERAGTQLPAATTAPPSRRSGRTANGVEQALACRVRLLFSAALGCPGLRSTSAPGTRN